MTRPPYDQLTEATGIPVADEAASMMVTRYALAAELARGRRTLEIACGSGPGLRMLASTARSVVGTDVNFAMLRRAGAHYGSSVPVMLSDAVALPFRDASFDFVLMLEASYYIEHFDQLVNEITRVLSPDGILLFVNANPDRPDFISSPYSFTYHSADDFRRVLATHGYRVQTSAAFPLDQPGTGGIASALIGIARKILEALHLVPRTLEGRAKLKRLLGLKLRMMPPEIDESFGPREPLVERPSGPITDYKVVYVVARRGAA